MKLHCAVTNSRIFYACIVLSGMLALGSAFVQPCGARQVPNAPTITLQPTPQIADYGSDVSFSVSASGAAPVTFQWQKNGENLIDYDNVAGAESDTLQLIGVAGNDVGNYQVIVSYAGGGSVTSSVATLTLISKSVFSDTFESSDANWSPLLTAKGEVKTNGLSVSQLENHTSGGRSGLMMSEPSQQVYHNLPVQYDCRIRYSFWFYDDGQNLTAGGELRGYSGPGYKRYISPGGLRQILGIGKVNSPFPKGNTGTLASETLDASKYQGHILRGTNAGWFNLDAKRTQGWHYFRIDRSAAGSGNGEVDFYVDGILARSMTKVTMAVVDSIFLGTLDIKGEEPSGSGVAYFDDVTVDAFPGLFDWQNLASSSPILDWMQHRETGTNWHVVNVTPNTVHSINGAETNSGLGEWAVDGSVIYSTGIRGYLDYTVNATLGGAYRIQVEGREKNYKTPVVGMPVEVFIDGESLGRLNLPYTEQANGMLHCFTPYIQAGRHTVRILWDNVDPRRSLLIQAVRLQDLLTADGSTALQPWVKNRLVAQNSLEVCPSSSLVSPVCIEGRGQYLSMMTLLAGLPGELSPVPVEHGAGHRWYANVPLSATNITTVLASYQNGGYLQSNDIVWQVCNLLATSNSITIRKGDSLLLDAYSGQPASGAVSIRVGNLASFTTDALAPIPYRFEQAGTFTVTGSYSPTGAIGCVEVTVVDASFEDSPISRVFFSRYWECTNLPPQVVLDADPRLKLIPVSDHERSRRTPELPAKGVNERDFKIKTRSTAPEYILARLGTNGPILANVAVRGFRWMISPDTYLRRIAVNPDGSQIVETAFVAAPTYPSLSADAQIISTGVTFEDGTVTKSISSQEFDVTGVCRVRFIRPATAKGSTCHTTKIYDNGNLIGWR